MGAIAWAFLAGHCLIHNLPRLPAPVIAVVLVSSLMLLLGSPARGNPVGRTLAAALLGVLWAWGHAAARLADDLPATLEGQELTVRGFIASLPESGADPQFLFDVSAAPEHVPARLRLTWYRAPSFPRPGEEWRFTVRLKRRNGFANPGGVDYERYLFRDGVGATGYVRDDGGNRRLRSFAYSYSVLRARAWIASRIASAVGDVPMLGVLQGLAIGDTQAMSVEQWRVFAATGMTHLMAISGLHIGMIAMLAAWCGGCIVRWPRAQALGVTAMHGRVVAGSTVAVSYSLLAGLSVPTQRTLMMLCIYFGLRWWRRSLDFAQSLSLAAIAILIVDPFVPLAPGAWLSFVAVMVILTAVSGRFGREGMIASFTRVQLAVTVGLTPLLLACFGSLSLIAPLANAIAVPLFTLVVVPTVLIGTVAAAIHPSLGAAVLTVPVTVLDASWPVFEWLGSHAWSIWFAPQPSLPVFAALLFGTVLLIVPSIWPLRLAGALLCLPMVCHRASTPPLETFELSVLDVGQGLSVAVRTHSHALIYDTGPAFPSGRSAADLAVLPYLRHVGVRDLDLLLVSHGDQDHSGGIQSILHAMPVRTLSVGPSVTRVPTPRMSCERGQQWTWDGVTFSILHPDAQGSALTRGNDSSCVLWIRSRTGSALLAGDIEVAAERELLSRGLPPVAVVVAPHHGSGSSSSSQFVDALGPDVTIFSTGYRNRWQFPNADVVKRWQAAGSRVFDTAVSGAVTVSFSSVGVQVHEHRREHRRYWNR